LLLFLTLAMTATRHLSNACPKRLFTTNTSNPHQKNCVFMCCLLHKGRGFIQFLKKKRR
jgi:hypothetical protein